MNVSKPVAKYAESIPAVTAPVKLPKLTPSLLTEWTNAIVAGAAGVAVLVLFVVGMSL